MAENLSLKVEKREVTGKKVRFLRNNGIVPVHLFGHNLESLELQGNVSDLKTVIAEAGKTRLIDLQIGDSTEPRAVMVREVQKNPIKGNLIHVDFYQVNLKEKIKVQVPVVFVGDAPALENKEYSLAREIDSLEVECLPNNMPDKIEIDVSGLTEVDQAIRVKDVNLVGIEILNDPDVMIAKINMVHVAAEEAAPAGGEAAPAAETKTEE